ncbi:hypothetical protein EAF04_005597 [Stromatinia cepivora]|nr:hypothetical protein EAF04_005597 [Stromatinia cepivora]
MSDSPDENPLFAIECDSSTDSSSTQETIQKVPRDFQSEESFQTVKREWRARIECGEIHKTLSPLPLNPRSKPQTAQFLYAIEELYFYKRYEEALRLVEGVLRQEDLMEDFRGTVERYGRRCEGRLREGEGEKRGEKDEKDEGKKELVGC